MSGPKTDPRKVVFLVGCAISVLALSAGITQSLVHGQSENGARDQGSPINVSAHFAQQWTDEGNEIALLRGRCRITQGGSTLTGDKAVLWRRTNPAGRAATEKMTVYLEGNVRLERPGRTVVEPSMYLVMETQDGVSIEASHSLTEKPAEEDAVFLRAGEQHRRAKRSVLMQTQLQVQSEEEQGPPLGPDLVPFPIQPQAGNLRRVRVFPRNADRFNLFSFQSEQTTPPEQISVLSGGVRLIIEGLEAQEGYGLIDLAADRMVIWTEPRGAEGFRAGERETLQSSDTPFTVYLEGNIVIRQGENIVEATHATYDAREQRALYYNVQLRMFVPQLQGDIRMRAQRIRQLSQDRFVGQNAWVTGSRFGVPGYRLRSKEVLLENRYTTPWLRLGPQDVDPVSGLPRMEPTPWITAQNNTFLVEEIPLLYTPRLSAPANDPQVPLRRISVGYDRIFGGTINTAWNMHRLLGLDEPDDMQWDLLLDAYSDRGPGIGTQMEYGGVDLFGLTGKYEGESLLYYIHDDGKDNLGADRRSIEPKSSDRGRVQWRHRQDLPQNLSIIGEIGFLSDRNFLQQYYEDEFEDGKDVETLIYGKQQSDNWAWTVLGRPQLNDFSTTTEWAPKGDLYVLSEPLLNGWLTWSSHSSVGYARLNQGVPPTDPTEVYTPIPYVADVDGGVFMTRHELNAPFSLGPVNIVPYALGEGAFWNSDFTGDDISRAFGTAGIRGSLLFWRAFPYVRSRIFNLNGMAHKVVIEGEYAYTDSSRDLSEIPQYNEIDDNAQERFLQRYPTLTFGGMVPLTFEPRFYAVRSGAGRTVTAPYHELVDDQQVARLALRQRLQTKVGPPDRLRIKDWMTLDLEASFFPDAARDNFGEDVGLINGHYRWNVGDRTSLLADAYYDLFDDAQQLWSLGVLSQRSERGSLYLGVHQVKGATLDSQILTASYSYQMSPKWVSTAGTAYDLGESRNQGQSLTVTRIGADFLWHVGTNYDASQNNAGMVFLIEPRFGRPNMSPSNLGSLLTTAGR